MGWARKGRRRKVLALLGEPWVHRIVVDAAQVDVDLVGDMTEILAAMCPRVYGKLAAGNRAKRTLAAAAAIEEWGAA